MLYVDGMEGVIRHNATIQWLYTLLASKVCLLLLSSDHFAVRCNSCHQTPHPLSPTHTQMLTPTPDSSACPFTLLISTLL